MNTDNNILLKLSCDEFDAFESKIDSEYFGIRSAKVILKKACILENRQNDLLTFLNNFEFSSITNKANDPFNNRWLGEKTTAFLTDMNIQLVKNASLVEINDGRDRRIVEIIDNFPGSDRVLQIAENAFEVSQFLNDPYLPKENARCIYADITKNAFGKPGRFFAVINSEEEVLGYLLFSFNHSSLMATIELLAIDQKHKGNGIGQSLVRSVEDYVAGIGMKTIKVGTQITNVGALNFYTSCGFKHLECNAIYHYWHSKN
jgi:ribosomal protein S18 acetylase RimI-like enzyme